MTGILCTLRYATGVRCREPASAAYVGRISKQVIYRCKEHAMGPGEMKDGIGVLWDAIGLEEAVVSHVMSS